MSRKKQNLRLVSRGSKLKILKIRCVINLKHVIREFGCCSGILPQECTQNRLYRVSENKEQKIKFTL